MLVTRSPKAVEKWLNDIVLNGLGWILSRGSLPSAIRSGQHSTPVCSMRITPRQRSAPSDHVPSLKECQSWPLNYTIQCILETSLTAPIILGAWSSLRTAKASIGLAPLAQFMPINAWLTTTTSIL
ncbi:hypothetical protein PCANC_17429 [Puccinia coronata f. sp. avenae]|uniref:Uncharacterized protein n=1 Tax=Puccinia coronata f. sp. avenae TaxID=200324 RepID=A0A2N5UV29_9BASI|nr:hypothetical protein PCANC_21458 [Puccinia coronata f. sp. avenae]PLW41584.1 hypothetical protein PCANC_17429 [Puccinia coronata f. sp. avenae]PLW47920.1 hypothetical protein PCASD_04941 [Puccinia coronata f. sp. avenae]